MTIETQKVKIVHDGDGVTTSFPFDYRLDDFNHMQVFFDNELMPGDYYIEIPPEDIGDPNGGTVFFFDSTTTDPKAPPAGSTIVLYRAVPLKQDIDYRSYDDFPADTHERGLDWLTMMVQQLAEGLSRTPRLPVDGSEVDDGFLPNYEPGKVIGWSESFPSLVNYPGIGTFEDLVDQSEAARDGSVAARDKSERWSEEDEDVEVEPGMYSAKHWAIKSAGGGLLDFVVEDRSVDELTARVADDNNWAYVGTRVNESNALLKLNPAGKVPTEQLPFSGLSLIGPIRGDNDCDKPGDDPGDCTEPDYRNPSERFPNAEYAGGDYWIITSDGDMNLRDRDDLGNPTMTVQQVAIGDGILYLPDYEDPENPGTIILHGGWFLLQDIVKRNVLASDVLFNDASTIIKGQNVQLWNQNADTAIDARVKKSGDTMTGTLGISNGFLEITQDAPQIRLYEADTIDQNYRIAVDNGTLLFQLLADDGSFIANAFRVFADGNVAAEAAAPSENNHLCRVDYVDGVVSPKADTSYVDAADDALQAQIDTKAEAAEVMPLSGGVYNGLVRTTIQQIGTVTGNQTITPNRNFIQATISGNATLTLNNPAQPCMLTLRLNATATFSFSIAVAGGALQWLNGDDIEQVTAGSSYIVSLQFNGTNWLANYGEYS